MDRVGPVDILVVEDNASQRASIVAAIETAVEDTTVAAVASREEALAVLFENGSADPPRLVLLDLTLAEGDTLGILERIRTCADGTAISHVPVVIFTDSQKDADIQEGYRLGANSYVIKPIGFLEFQRVVGAVARYWLNCNQASA